ncbi:hypothetical protein I4U23_014300 [Adineta vaga]|nr:hypothetical protein I4U23_014300 [Adineta vaga]
MYWLHLCIFLINLITICHGQCSMSSLNTFLQNSSVLVTMVTDGSYNLTTNGMDVNSVLSGSFISMKCNSGYTFASGQLNITCVGTTWSTFPTCISTTSGSGSGMTTVISAGNGSPCIVDMTTAFNITNGYYVTSSLSLTSSTMATGSIQFACVSGYVLDSTIGGSYICNNGVWSTKPRCLMTGRCSYTALQTFISTATALRTTDQQRLMAASQDTTVVFNDSYIVLTCANGYVNTGGSLNVTCLSNSSWTQFPNCVLSTGSGSITTTTISTSNGLPCAVDPNASFNITNGYYTSSSLSYTTNTTATGWIQFTCMPGYVLDPNIGTTYTCNNGVWSNKPQCLITGRCSYTALQTFIYSTNSLQTTGQNRLLASSPDATVVFNDSYIIVACVTGYTNIGGSLNITCLSNGSWTSFPNCVLNTGSGSVTTTPTTTTTSSGNGVLTTTTITAGNGSPCVVDSNTFIITNGYYTNTSLSYISTTTATGWIQFACMPGYILDSTVGATYTCTNGVWSTKPRCSITARCSFATLQNFIASATGMVTTDQKNLMASALDTTVVFLNSFILLQCANGYINTGGSLNITCLSTGSWSQFPNCVLNGGSSSMTTTTTTTTAMLSTTSVLSTTTAASSTGLACTIDATIFTITNGYFSSSSLSYTSASTATGTIQFACMPGYVLDATIGASTTCNNGVWSTKPKCSITARCSFATLQNFISTATGIQTTDQRNLLASGQDTSVVFVNSYIVFTCASGYVNTGGSLNVTCLTGSWTQFPNCVSNGGTTSIATTTTTTIRPGTGLACSIDASTFTLTNGYYLSSTLSYTSATTATGSIQFACMPGYVLDATTGASTTCNNGVWSTKPVCSITARCSFATLQNFISTATGIQTTDQRNLLASGQDTSVVYVNSFIVFTCASGYVNTGGSLNVTCLSTGSWTQFPNCVSNNGGFTTTMATSTVPNNGVGCPIDATIFTITNGYFLSSSLTYPTSTTVTGSIQFACMPGYVLDSTIGSSYTCSNGVWSTKPRCSITARCSFSTLQNFISTATGIQTTDQRNLLASGQDTSVVFVNSYIVFTCASGYVNTGGSLNVTCLSTGSWTQFPNCVSNGGTTSITTTTTTTTIRPGTGLACSIDASTFTLTNGYYLSSTLSYTSGTTATGSIQFACMPGYVLDATIGASTTCNNGVWSTKPKCSITARCSFATLQNFISTATGIQTTDQRNLLASGQDTSVVFVNSYIVFTCASGYVNTGGSLNVTCLSTGSWTQFPNCVSNGGTTSIATTTTTTIRPGTGLACSIDASTFTLTNGYYLSSTLSYTSATTATGSIQFACMPGYVLDVTVGASYICNNGVWSTKPRCTLTARCSFSALQNFISTATGMQTTDQRNLLASGQDTSVVFVNSFIVFVCASGYANIGGSLNVTCLSTGSWTQFPNCVSNGGTTSMTTTTTVKPSTGLSCSIDASTFTVTNGYYSSSSLTYTSATTVTGSIQFACMPGYVLDSTVGASYTCNNGVWSTKPRCSITARCSLSALQSFISTASGIQITDQKNLLSSSQETNAVLVNSFIVFACANGYVNTAGSLNVTCLSSGSWTQFPNCIVNGGSGSITTTTQGSSNGLGCSIDASTSFVISNGYYLSSSLTYTTATTATGWIKFACTAGYILDQTIGSSYTCNNGVWSSKPRCLITGRCSYTTLKNFISTSSGAQVTNQNRLTTAPEDSNAVLNDSFIVFTCANGYINTGGSLNVTCLSTGSWSQFPNCVLNGGSGSVTTTTLTPSNGLACVADTSTFTITNGYYTNSSLSYTTATTVTGWIQFACMPGYALDSTVGATYTCNNGIWSTKPRCSVSTRCSFSTLQNFLSSATGIQTTDQKNLVASSQDASAVFLNSFIVLQCASGYVNTGGSLNVTCLSTGLWTQFPNCVYTSGSGSLTTTTTTTTMAPGNGLACMIDASTFVITNGYYSSSSLNYTSATTVTGWIQFGCITGYTLDPTIGATYTCTSGVWSRKPTCQTTVRCLFSTLQNFLTSATGIQATDQKNLVASSQDTTVVFVNSLNVTCLSTGSWTQFPNCVYNGGSGSLTTTTTTTTIKPGTGIACVVDTSTFIITNGYYSSSSLNYISATTATGWIQFACGSGYVLDSTIGASYTCNSGIWSNKPRCLATGRCTYSALQNFVSTAIGIQPTSQSRLVAVAQETNAVLNGSYILFTCLSGYINTGGNLNVTCLNNGSWSQFPNCVYNGGSGSITTTTISTGSGLACAVDTVTFTISNGYYLSSSLSYLSSTTATGWIQFACSSGYVLDSSIGATYTCTNGVWSKKPQCLMTGRCSYTTLTNFLSSASGLQSTNQNRLVTAAQDSSTVLNDSYIVLTCSSGYINIGGSLNVTCLANSSWSQFPNCILNSGIGLTTTTTTKTTTTVSTATGSPCMIDATTYTITNGYYSSSSLSYTSATAATGWIEFACVSGYTLDLTIGARYICNNGIWSTKPRCTIITPCSYSTLNTFVLNSNTLKTTNDFRLTMSAYDSSAVLSNSYVVLACISGYTNVAGNLNVTCLSNGSWTQFPKCVQSGQATTVSSSTGVYCSYISTFLIITNGYANSYSGIMSPSASQALSGAYINYVCISPHVLVGNSRMTCTNGVWSAQPTCSGNLKALTLNKEIYCSFHLSHLLASNQGSVTTTQSSADCSKTPSISNGYVSSTNNVLQNNIVYSTKVEYTCYSGYSLVSTSGQRTVSCTNGIWDPLPVCTASASCSLTQLSSALVNVKVITKSLYSGNNGILAGSWIQIQCADGFRYNSLSGPLNITCLTTGSWTQFPLCS